jgi:CheY-like chemotaxis protein
MSFFNYSGLSSCDTRHMNEHNPHVLDELAKVLIVEDEQCIAWDIEHLLRDHGAGHILAANSLVRARELLAQHDDIDLVLLDLKFPDGSGHELVPLLQERQIPIVVTTGDCDPQCGDIPVLYKPYSTGTFLSVVLAAVAKGLVTT